MSEILAINASIEDESTGAIAKFHVIEFYSVDLKYKAINATLNGYVSRAKYEQGRNAVTSHSLTIQGLPDDLTQLDLDWLYNQAISKEADSVFTGAKLVKTDSPKEESEHKE